MRVTPSYNREQRFKHGNRDVHFIRTKRHRKNKHQTYIAQAGPEHTFHNRWKRKQHHVVFSAKKELASPSYFSTTYRSCQETDHLFTVKPNPAGIKGFLSLFYLLNVRNTCVPRWPWLFLCRKECIVKTLSGLRAYMSLSESEGLNPPPPSL